MNLTNFVGGLALFLFLVALMLAAEYVAPTPGAP